MRPTARCIAGVATTLTVTLLSLSLFVPIRVAAQPIDRLSQTRVASVQSAVDEAAFDQAVFDHSAFDALLKVHVVNGMVNYGAFKNAPSFERYLRALAQADPKSLPRDEQLALWLNAYNAYTIKLIFDNAETKSIRNINKTFGLKLKGPWSEPMAVVGGKTYTLDDIEHKIIRPTFGDSRIHFALVCAAMGCPPLRNEAYTGATLDQQLHDQGTIFLRQSPQKNRVDVGQRTFYHSMIFDVYKSDFGGTLDAAAKFVAQWYAVGSPERRLLESPGLRTKETDYDWTLNSQENARVLKRQ